LAWLKGYSKRIPITIDAGDISSDLTWFPVYVYLSGSSGKNSKDITEVISTVGDNYKACQFTAEDGVTRLYCEVESWTVGPPATAHLWVSLDGWVISSSQHTILYLYYSGSSISEYWGVPGSTTGEAVWDGNFKLVCHMNDNPDTSHFQTLH